jgi:hypothetical protein
VNYWVSKQLRRKAVEGTKNPEKDMYIKNRKSLTLKRKENQKYLQGANETKENRSGKGERIGRIGFRGFFYI